ncbi:MAG: hypothetical protein QGH93_03075 [Gammaproteobacteria bacterium]|nr:hypothetical protein [Gammaproteobacteria bacterium]
MSDAGVWLIVDACSAMARILDTCPVNTPRDQAAIDVRPHFRLLGAGSRILKSTWC